VRPEASWPVTALDNHDANNYLGHVPLPFAAGDETWGLARTVRFIWPNVPRGTHKVQLFYSGSGDGGGTLLSRPMMVVKYMR
jgi:hypothetical protein